MNLRVATCVLLFAAGSTFGQTGIPPEPQKIRSAVPSPGISGWQMPGEEFLREHVIYLDSAVRRSGHRSVSLNALLPKPSSPGHTILIQYVDAKGYRDKRVRFSAFLRSEMVDGANLFVRIDGGGMVVVNQDQMQNRRLTGTTDWKEQEIVLDVPADAEQIVIGIRLFGGGQLWADDASLGIVDQNVPVTGERTPEQIRAGSAAYIEKYKASQSKAFDGQLKAFRKRGASLPDTPQNLDFEN